MPDQLPSSAAPGRAPDQAQPRYYRPSGKVPRSAILVAPVCGLAVLPCAFLYAWLTMGAPAFVNVAALAIFALCIALAVERAARWARVRSHDWITRFAVALALCAWYAQWIAWVALALHRQQGGAAWRHAGELVADPGALLAAVAYAAQHDAWGAGVMPMAAIWLAEAYILLHFAPGLGQQRTAQPYCEASDTWAEELPVACAFACVADPGARKQLLEQLPQQLPNVLLPLAGPADRDHTTVTLYRCRGGATFATLCNRTAVGGKDARRTWVEQAWVTALRVPGIHADTLMTHLLARGEAVAAPAASEDDATIPPELASALALFQAAQFHDALARALPHVQSAQPNVRIDANRLCALSCMRQGRWEASLVYWQAVFCIEAAAANALQLAGCTVMAGDLAAGADWFARARALNAAAGELPPLSLLTTYVSALDMAGHPRAAMPVLGEIREAYCACRTTDPTVLFANRMPLLNEFLDRSLPIVMAALGRVAGLRWFAAMLGRLDEAGNVELGQWLDEQSRSVAG
jgi:hypothetical protein